jgi:hypothetical protein
MITILSLFLFVLGALAVDVPIFLTGALIDATATDDSYNTGGTISVNGWVVNVPKNMIVTFPAAYVPWKDFVANKTAVMGFEVTVSTIRKSRQEASVRRVVLTWFRFKAILSMEIPSQPRSSSKSSPWR